VIVALGMAALTVVGSIVWAVLRPPPRIPLVPLLGYMDRPLPSPRLAPTPIPSAAAVPGQPGEPTPEPSYEPVPVVTPEPISN
jgi:hypothetical protein